MNARPGFERNCACPPPPYSGHATPSFRQSMPAEEGGIPGIHFMIFAFVFALDPDSREERRARIRNG